jgi:hypothetical protein
MSHVRLARVTRTAASPPVGGETVVHLSAPEPERGVRVVAIYAMMLQDRGHDVSVLFPGRSAGRADS